ncbi:DNA polymerase alpha subunit A [Phakopsora pachyrhizi]|uniref:DNA polymerase n=1 Tax=Phakopsora pachyrhizi TaxID=170000 RepID=A0AAV0BHG1_PHAPC|nr:DNA polymerase alpha subunit A [Phakopsora pachyrhizi]
MSSKRDKRKAGLEALKAARAGQKREYVSEDNEIYMNVSEDEYERITRNRLEENEFIENDDDSGYVDQGAYEFDQQNDEKRNHESKNFKKQLTKGLKADAAAPGISFSKKNETPAHFEKADLGVSSSKTKASDKQPLGLSAYRKNKDPVASEDFMKNILGSLGPEKPQIPSISKKVNYQEHKSGRTLLEGYDSRKRKGSLQEAEMVENKPLVSEFDYRHTVSASSPSDHGIAYPSSQGDDRSSNVGIDVADSSELVEQTERYSKKPRITESQMLQIHKELIGLDMDDFAFDDLDLDVSGQGVVSEAAPADSQFQKRQVSESTDAKPFGPMNGVSSAPGKNCTSTALSKRSAVGEVPPLSVTLSSKPNLSGLDWREAVAGLPSAFVADSAVEANLRILIEGSDEANRPFARNSEDQEMETELETTEFLANIPRMNKKKPAPRISKKAVAKAEADRHLPQLTKVEAFEPRTVSGLKQPIKEGDVDESLIGDSLKFFWLDINELNGVIYLFGKVFDQLTRKYVACCVTVEGLERNLFFLPKETILDEDGIEVKPTEDDVYDEIEEVLQAHDITEFKSKVVSRKYCFEQKNVPWTSDEWHKVVYSYKKPAIPTHTTGRTFSKVFGAGTSAIEIFLLKRKIMGPCWLNIAEVFTSSRSVPVSWCKLEVTVKDPKAINPFSDSDSTMPKDLPPLNIMSLSMRNIMNHSDNKKEVVCATARVWQDVSIEDATPIERQPSTVKTFVRPLISFPRGFQEACCKQTPVITAVKEEKNLLSFLLGTISLYDPDIIVGYDLVNATLDVFLHRMRDLKTFHWSRIGRFRRDKLPSLRIGGFHSHLLTGRLVCDLSSDGFKSMVSSTTWSMSELCQKHLGISREDIDPDEVVNHFDPASETPLRLINFIKHCEADSYFQMALIHKVQYMSLTKQLTNLAGNSWNATLSGGRAQRNEYILLHEFHRQKYICPDKLSFIDKKSMSKPTAKETAADGTNTSKTVKKDKYKGGLVFEPKKGLWDRFILVMDFNSLYPSIIQEYNIDFTTVDRSSCNENEDEIPDLPPIEMKQGILPRLIATLVNRRRQVKSLMKDRDVPPSKMIQYDIKQMALKLTANSMYGCLGFEGSRFYARALAALTTSKGREILTNTRDLAETQNLDVIYGDTDSVMINTNALDFLTAKKIGGEFKKLVNERYKLLEIDIDAIFERMLLLQKKKYAALKIDESTQARVVEVKGLDMKRREFCKLSKDASQYVLEQILSGLPTESVVEKVHEYLVEFGESVRKGCKDLEDYIIYKKLGKNPQDYPDAKSQPHVQVALKMKLKGNTTPKAGDVIPYIFCLGEDGSSSTKSAQADKARHPDDLRRKGSNLKIDYDYYLSLQVLPAIERLCDSIEGTDRSRLAECLGLDPSRFQSNASVALDVGKEFHTLDSQTPDAERFKEATPFSVRCRHCSETTEFRGLQADTIEMISTRGLCCPNLMCRMLLGLPSLVAQLEVQIRSHISKYYQAWIVCDEPACRNRTRMVSVYGRKCLNNSITCKGVMSYEYTDRMLYDQLLYYDSLFDPSKAQRKFKETSKSESIEKILKVNQESLNILRGVTEKYLRCNGRRYVSMKSLFSFMTLKETILKF